MGWVANHRHHHAKTDTAEDVSSPRHGGFWWAHIKWVYQWSGSEVRRWCPDLDKPRYRVWRRLQIPVVALSILSGLALGWEAFFWVGAIRLVYVLHFQMFVNSLLHMTPGLPEGVDSSRNIWWLGPLQLGGWGENWHSNHHSDANAARFGSRWWQIDVGWYVICGLKALRLASDVRPTRDMRKAKTNVRHKSVEESARRKDVEADKGIVGGISRIVLLLLLTTISASAQDTKTPFPGILSSLQPTRQSQSNEEEFIKASRPSVANSAEVHKAGVLQLEYGYDGNFRADEFRAQHTASLSLRFAASSRLLFEFDHDTLGQDS